MNGAGVRAPAAYRPAVVEPRWQLAWQQARTFETGSRPRGPKWFIVELPPFATGQLHIGHARNYVMADAGARFARMQGYDVLYTSGFDTFGLPTELAARAAGCSPQELADSCSQAMGEQFVRLGLGHDRRRITAYHVPEFYRWVQWVFVRLFKAGHCFRRAAAAQWCPRCEIALPASLVEDGCCWRCGSKVGTRMLAQWFVRESAFADQMLDGLDSLAGWPDSVRKIHRDWIGRRSGLRLLLPLRGLGQTLELGIDGSLSQLRFIAIGRDHPLAIAAGANVGPQGCALLPQIAQAAGARAAVVDIPILVEDVAGDGARPGLPQTVAADRALAERHGLAWDADAPACDLEAMQAAGQAERTVRYRLQDWNIARNRYWGPPVPIVHCEDCGPVAVPEDELPVLLPQDVDLQQPGNPLERHAGFCEAACPHCGKPARRDAETLEAYSSPWWYHWMCKSPGADSPFEREDARAWLPVDLMIGGSDQVRSCFFHVRMIARALRDMGISDVEEPVQTLLALGMVKQDNRKMSKSAGNAADLDAIIERHGADALRLAILGAAAPESDFNWSETLVRRAHAFLASVWDFVDSLVRTSAAGAGDRSGLLGPLEQRMQVWLGTAGKRIATNFRRHQYHLAVRNLEFLFERLQAFDAAMRKQPVPSGRDVAVLADATRQLVLFLGPLAPHVAEELWQSLGGQGMLAAAAWPQEAAAAPHGEPALEAAR